MHYVRSLTQQFGVGRACCYPGGMRRAVALALLVLGTVSAADADARTTGRVAVLYGVKDHKVTASGKIRGVPARRARVVLERRKGKRKRIVARGRLRHRQVNLRWRYPGSAKRLQLRVRVVRKQRTLARGRFKRLNVANIQPGSPTQRIAPSSIVSAPAPGGDGDLVLNGTPAIEAGTVLTSDVSRATPFGMLARATGVRPGDGQTTVTTTPATLPEVIPVGALDIQLPSSALARAGGTGARLAQAGSRTKKTVECTNGQRLILNGETKLTAGVSLGAGWKFNGFFRLPSVRARFEGNAGVQAELEAILGNGATCELEATPLLAKPVRFATLRFFVSGIPVIVTPEGQIFLQARAQVAAGVKAKIEGSVTGRAGVEYDGGDVRPISSLEPKFAFERPTVTAGGTLEASLAPTLDILFYGDTGPSIDFRAGLELAADEFADPWWELKAPISAGALLRLSRFLDISTPRVEVFSRELTLARAKGPFGGTKTPPPAALAPGTRAVITWDTKADVDLHTWDIGGAHAWFEDPRGIQGSVFTDDINPPFGPESFREEVSPDRGYTFGICQFEGEAANVKVRVFDPGGRERAFDITLRGKRAAALVTGSPDTGAAYVPPQGWCNSSRIRGEDPKTIGQTTDGYFGDP